MAAKKAGKWYRGVLEAAERFMARWHEDGAKLSRQRQESTMGAVHGNGEETGNRRRAIGVDEKQEGDGRQSCKIPGRLDGRTCLLCYVLVPQTTSAASNVKLLWFG